jgi:6-phosphogluconolactonase
LAVLTIVDDERALAATAAERITALIEGSIRERSSAFVSLTGGSTPRTLYRFLGDPTQSWRARIDWSRVHLFWGDEREVPPEHAESNFGLANRFLIQHVPVPPTQIHRMRGELPASDAGRLYDALLRARRDQTAGPLFDVMLLGIGANAHIASIFPNSPVLERPERSERPERLATGVHVTEISQWRITMTPPALLDSAAILMIADAASKAEAIAAAVEAPLDIARYPAQLLRAAGDRVEWIIDSAASARLRGVPPA